MCSSEKQQATLTMWCLTVSLSYCSCALLPFLRQLEADQHQQQQQQQQQMVPHPGTLMPQSIPLGQHLGLLDAVALLLWWLGCAILCVYAPTCFLHLLWAL